MRRLLALLLLFSLLAACGGPSNPSDPANGTPSDDGVATISFATWEYDRPRYEALAQSFSAANPGIQVVIVTMDDIMNMPGDMFQNDFEILRRLVSSADTAANSLNVAIGYGTNLLTDLRPLMDADASFQRDDFYPGALDYAATKGGTWVLPRALSIPTISYNRDLFQLANLPEPQANLTWSDLMGIAEQLTRQRGSTVDVYGMVEPSDGFLPVLEILHTQGVNLLTEPVEQLQFDRPEVVAAVEQVRALRERGILLQPYRYEGPGVDLSQLIRDGQLAIWPSTMIAPETYSFSVGTAPFPASIPGLEFVTGSGITEGYIISGGTRRPQEAWRWIEFLSRQPFDQGSEFSSYFIPARRSVADQAGFWSRVDAQTAAVYQAIIADPAARASDAIDFNVTIGIIQTLSQAVNSTGDPAQALRESQRQFLEALAELQLTPTPVPDTGPVVVATPERQIAPEGAVTITFAAPGYTIAETRRLARAFNRERNDIFVQVVSTDNLTSGELREYAQAGDCFPAWQIPQSEADFAALLDLQPLFETDSAALRDDYPAALLAAYARDGGIYGLPYAFNLRSLNFNRTAFDTAGVSLPDYRWQPAEFLAAAQALTRGSGDARQYGYVSRDIVNDLYFFVHQMGGQLTSGSGSDARPTFTDPGAVAAIQWFLDLDRVHGVMPPIKITYRADDFFEDRSYELVMAGRAGMWLEYGQGMFSRSSEPTGPDGQPLPFEVGIAPLPVGGAGLRYGDFYLRGFYISARTQYPQACWEWLKFLSTDATQLYGDLPARQSLLQAPAFTDQAPPEALDLARIYAEPLQRAAASGSAVNALQSGAVDSYWFFKALNETLEQGVDLGQALAEAQATTTAFIECVAAGGSSPACARQVDPNYAGYLSE